MRRAQSWALGCMGMFVSLLGVEGAARAQATATADEAEAQRLATEAWKLAESGRAVEACVSYRKALSLKRSPGLLNNVGRCFEQEGDPVRAMETFESSVDLAKQQEPSPKRQAWLQFARQEMDQLEPQLSKLVFHLPRLAGLELSLDGEQLAADSEYVYVKPGVHHLEVTAPGHQPHAAELIPTAGERMQVEVPTLAPAAAVAAAPARAAAEQPLPAEPAASEEPAERHSSHRVWPWVMVGTGSAVLAAGAVTGLIASSKEQELERHCPDDSCPSAAQEAGWQHKIDSTRTTALVTDVLWGVGLATIGVGVTLLIVGGDTEAPDEHAALDVTCRGDGCGLRLQGRF